MFYEKFKELCEMKGVSQSRAAEDNGVTRAAVGRWKNGATPQKRTIRDLAEYFGVTMDYFGAEEIKKPLPKIDNGDLIDITLRMIPVYESVSAGFGTLARNEVIERVPCVIKSIDEANETIGIRVHGDSMYPKIEDGDIIVVHKQTSVDNGTIAVVIVDGDEGLVKRVDYGAEFIHLISINPMYPVMKFNGPDVLRVQVVGRVTKIIKDV